MLWFSSANKLDPGKASEMGVIILCEVGEIA